MHKPHKPELVYLACPYSHDDDRVRRERSHVANEAATRLMERGLFIFSPISHTHPISEYGLPKGWDFWERFDRPYLEVSKAMVILAVPGWGSSTGVKAERQIMEELGRPVFHLFWPIIHEDIDRLVEELEGHSRS